MERKLVATGTVALALAIAGCGSSGPMTRAAFLRQANIYCTQRKTRLRAIVAKHPTKNIRTMTAESFSTMKAELKRLESLRPPAELKREFDSIMTFERNQVKSAEYFIRTGRISNRYGEDGPPLHAHERMRVRLNMFACEEY